MQAWQSGRMRRFAKPLWRKPPKVRVLPSAPRERCATLPKRPCKRTKKRDSREQTGTYADVVQWQNTSLPSWECGFDSRYPLHVPYAELPFSLPTSFLSDLCVWDFLRAWRIHGARKLLSTGPVLYKDNGCYRCAGAGLKSSVIWRGSRVIRCRGEDADNFVRLRRPTQL